MALIHSVSYDRCALILILLTVEDSAVFRAEHHSNCTDGATPPNNTHDCEVDDRGQILWLCEWFAFFAQLEIAVKGHYIDYIDRGNTSEDSQYIADVREHD